MAMSHDSYLLEGHDDYQDAREDYCTFCGKMAIVVVLPSDDMICEECSITADRHYNDEKDEDLEG